MKQWTNVEPDPAPEAKHPLEQRDMSKTATALIVGCAAVTGGALLALALWMLQQIAQTLGG